MEEKPKGKKTLVVTNAGGPGVLLTDLLTQDKLDVVPLPVSLKFDLPASWSHNNPIDVIGDATSLRFREVFSKLLTKKFYDNVLIVLTPQDMTDSYNIAQEIVTFYKKSQVTVICCPLGEETFRKAIWLLEDNNIPCLQQLERASKLLGNLMK